MPSKAQKVIDYYLLCHTLKDTIRTGWQVWNAKRDRLESIAEHIYGVQMLAIAMKSEYRYDIDLTKVIFMLAIHELGETVIGDLTQFEIDKADKEKVEHVAVHKILANLLDGEQIEALFREFDAHETPEAKFAYQCDKLECDLQCKLYNEENCVDLTDQADNKIMQDARVQELFKTCDSWSEMWLKFGQQTYPYDKNFRSVSNYAIKHKLQK